MMMAMATIKAKAADATATWINRGLTMSVDRFGRDQTTDDDDEPEEFTQNQTNAEKT